jgi:putative DNA methylase
VPPSAFSVQPLALKDAPALIERLLPVQKLSAEAFKEQMAGSGKTLTALGSYWKGRKPLILNKACILGCLLPATENPKRDLEVFEKLMAMDDESFVPRWPRRFKPREILATLSIARTADYFVSEPPMLLPPSAPVDWSKPELQNVKVQWRGDITELERRQLEAQMLPKVPYRALVDEARRAEEVMDTVHTHIWDAVNTHLGTRASSLPELIEQLGILRYGHRPRVADTFCGSGQIPFEAARLGCDVYASDLNPVACMLTWGALHIVGGSPDSRVELECKQKQLVKKVESEIDKLDVETDGNGWRIKALLYCIEARCPQSGWMVPLIPSLIISKPRTGERINVVAELAPDHEAKRYDIAIKSGVGEKDLADAELGTVRREGKFGEAYLLHRVHGADFKTKISTLRGDYTQPDGSVANKLRQWEKSDFMPRPDDVLQERLYCIQWTRPKPKGKGEEYEFRSVTEADLRRERAVQEYLSTHITDWQTKGWLPDMQIEVGGPPRYQGLDLVRARGWRFWHHLFTPRQLLVAGLINQFTDARLKFGLGKILNANSRLSRWDNVSGGGGCVQTVFDNQALNTLFNYGCRGFAGCTGGIQFSAPQFPTRTEQLFRVISLPSDKLNNQNDIYITDPPYGDAVKYEEILDFFIAWVRKNPPPEFADWVWDSRRTLAIKGEDEDFRRGMVAAYKRMSECMPDNGIQVIMFTHQSGSIWADMANIVWASGLQVTAAWYVVTETDSALREGSNVKGTVLLVLRKRHGTHKTTRDDLAWEIQEEVEKQIRDLTGLNQEAKGLYRDENVFEDADIQMAGYAAALRVLTRYAVIDGRDMAAEAIRPRVKGETTFVDGLISFAVDTANQCLVPQGIPERHWKEYSGAERFYLKLLDLEAKGLKTLDNYQNFAKAFKVRDFRAIMGSQKANEARLRGAVEFGKNEMSEGSEMHQSVLRAVLYAVMELAGNMDGNDVLAHLILNVPDYYSNQTQRERVAELADYLAKKLETLRPDEASAARVLREMVKNQRLG